MNTLIGISGILTVALLSSNGQTPSAVNSTGPTAKLTSEKLTVARTYKLNEVDKYDFLATVEGGTERMVGVFSDTVKKVYPNGDADLFEQSGTITSGKAGWALGARVGPSSSAALKVDKYGLILGFAPSNPSSWALLMMALPGEIDGIALKESVPFTRSLPVPGPGFIGSTVSGEVSLESMNGGKAKFKVVATLTPPGSRDEPRATTTVGGYLTWDIQFGRYIRADLFFTEATPSGSTKTIVTVTRTG